jgi:hypothetical protein
MKMIDRLRKNVLRSSLGFAAILTLGGPPAAGVEGSRAKAPLAAKVKIDSFDAPANQTNVTLTLSNAAGAGPATSVVATIHVLCFSAGNDLVGNASKNIDFAGGLAPAQNSSVNLNLACGGQQQKLKLTVTAVSQVGGSVILSAERARTLAAGSAR